MIPLPTPTCVSDLDILAETSTVFLHYIHTAILATIIFNTIKKTNHVLKKSENYIMTVYLLK